MSEPASVAFSVCIPTLNPGRWIDRMIPALAMQDESPARILVIDSSSTDGTVQRFGEVGAEILTIPQREFDHAGTRNLGLATLAEPIVVYLTQDAIPTRPSSLRALVSGLASDGRAGLAYGRQKARPDAHIATRTQREFLYPPASATYSLADLDLLGVRASFASNAFCAYRRTALEAIGGFSYPSICSEDRRAAAYMMQEGWHISYVADAEVEHSHNYTFSEQFRRYFDLGVVEIDDPWYDATYGRPSGEGWRMVKRQLNGVRHEGTARESAEVLTSAGVALIAHRLGRFHQRLPPRLKLRASMNPGYFAHSGT